MPDTKQAAKTRTEYQSINSSIIPATFTLLPLPQDCTLSERKSAGLEPGTAYALSIFIFRAMTSIMSIILTQAIGNNQEEEPIPFIDSARAFAGLHLLYFLLSYLLQ